MKFSRYIAAFLAFVLFLSVFPYSALAAGRPERLSGSDRYHTAAAISQAGWEKAETVVLARGDQYADALAGVSLAFKEDAPILLTRPDSLHPATQAELERLEAKNVIILGGAAAVAQAVEDQLADLGLNVERVRGANRHGTAAAVAGKVAPNGVDTAVIAYGSNFPDALAAASYAAAAGYPILLTDKAALPQETKDALKGLGVKNTIVVGGTGAIADSVLAELPEPIRVKGANRFATSVALAEHFQVQADHFYLSTGWNFADAITGSVLAAKEGAGLLLVDRILTNDISDFLVANRVKSVCALGGTGSVSEEVLREIEELLSNTSGYTLTISGPTSVAVKQPTEFTVNLKGDGKGVADLFGALEYEITGGQGVLEYQDGEEWKVLPLKGHFGPQGGFAITPDWDVTTHIRFTAAEAASFTASVTLKSEGEVVTSETFNFSTTAGVVPENFSVTRDESKNYLGYSVGFRLTEGLTPADLTAVEVSLLKGERVLMTNTATEALFALEDLQHTSPFNVYAEFAGYTEEYWNLGQWQGELLDVPDKAVIKVVLKDGREITVENTNLTGDVSAIQPKAWNQEQKKGYDTVQAAITAAAAGDTIFLAPGVHTGHLNIAKSINLAGADEETVVIDASLYTAYGIYVKADDVSFSNFTFIAPAQNTPHTYGFKVEDSENVSFTNVTVKDSYHTGLDLNKVTGATVENVSVDGTVYGVGLAMTDCEDVTVTNSSFTNNAWGSIAVYESGKGIFIGAGNAYDVIYTEGDGEFEADLSESGVQYVAADVAKPQFTFYFDALEKAQAAAEKLTVISNLEASEFYVFAGMSIQAAVEAVEDGAAAEIFVHEGAYAEDVVIAAANLTLTGVNLPEVIGTFRVNASGVTLQGFFFAREGAGVMVQIANADDVVIVNNLFMGDGRANAIALGAGTPSNVIVQGNIFRFLHTALYITRGEDVTFSNNYLTDIAEAAVSIEVWARNVAVNENYLSFANALIFFWSEYYSQELVFADEVTYSGNEYFMVVSEIASDKE